jgi:hypothetical protein
MKHNIKYTDDKGEMKGIWKTLSEKEIGLPQAKTFQRFLHGGKRPGAGRKRGMRIQYVTRLSPRLIRRIKATARRTQKPECEIVESWLQRASA